MSALSEQDRLNPNHPLYYAPRSLRERSASRPSTMTETISAETITEPLTRPAPAPSPFDLQLENAVSEALRQQLAPRVVHEPPALVRELDRQKTLFGFAGRFAAAAGASAVVALLFIVISPGSWQSNGGASSSSGFIQSIRTVLPQSAQTTAAVPVQSGQAFAAPIASKPALAEFQAVLAPSVASQIAPSTTSQSVTYEQSEELLRAFVQWRENPNSTQAGDK
jgi:hypothetical protein